MHSEAFNQVLDRTLPAAMQQFADMSEQERRRLAEQGEAELLRLRSEPDPDRSPAPPTASTPVALSPRPVSDTVVPGTRKLDRERIVTLDEDDEDDEYFRERHRRGWLA